MKPPRKEALGAPPSHAPRASRRAAVRLVSALCFFGSGALLVPACSSTSGGGAQNEGLPIAESDAASALVQAICKPMFHDCACGSTVFASEAACAKQIRDLFGSFQTEAHDHGIAYDGACTRSIVGFYDQNACAAPGLVGALLGSCEMGCRMFHGSLPVDSVCKLADEVNECAQGLGCQRPVTDGQPVGPSQCRRGCVSGVLLEGAKCDVNAPVELGCAPKLVCSQGGICYPLPKPGSACDQERCAPGAFCAHQLDGPPLCYELLAGGASCDTGAPCASADCQSGTCAPVVPYVCSLGANSFLF